jgi:hypothetical protein
MLTHKNKSLADYHIKHLFPLVPECQAAKEASTNLCSNVITAYEQSIDGGLQPIDALSIITRWVSREMTRISAQFNGASIK